MNHWSSPICASMCLLIDEVIFCLYWNFMFVSAFSISLTPHVASFIPSISIPIMELDWRAEKKTHRKCLDCLINIRNVNWLLLSIWIKQTSIKHINRIIVVVVVVGICCCCDYCCWCCFDLAVLHRQSLN